MRFNSKIISLVVEWEQQLFNNLEFEENGHEEKIN